MDELCGTWGADQSLDAIFNAVADSTPSCHRTAHSMFTMRWSSMRIVNYAHTLFSTVYSTPVRWTTVMAECCRLRLPTLGVWRIGLLASNFALAISSGPQTHPLGQNFPVLENLGEALDQDCVQYGLLAQTVVETEAGISDVIQFSAAVDLDREQVKVTVFQGGSEIWRYQTDGKISIEVSENNAYATCYLTPVEGARNVENELPFDGCEIAELLTSWVATRAEPSRQLAVFLEQASRYDVCVNDERQLCLRREVEMNADPNKAMFHWFGNTSYSFERRLTINDETKFLQEWLDVIEHRSLDSCNYVRLTRKRTYLPR